MEYPLSRDPLKTKATIYVSKECWGVLRSISEAIEQLTESYGHADNQELSEALEDFEAGVFTMAAYQRIGGGCPEIESMNANDLSIVSRYIQRILRDRITVPILTSVAAKGIGANVCFRLALLMALSYEFVLEEVAVALHNQYLEHFYHMLICEQEAEN